MTIKQIKKEIKGVFKPPVKQYYCGKLAHGTPYFYPCNFVNTIFFVRKLKLQSKEQLIEQELKYPHLKRQNSNKFTNLPMVRRSKNWTISILKQYWYVEIGWPVSIGSNQLGWKDKWNSPRCEWSPCFYIYFFNWQFIIWWNAPDNNNHLYYEMILWYVKYSKKDIKAAEQTWGWVDSRTKLSTWQKNYLI